MNELSKTDLEFILDYLRDFNVETSRDFDFCDLVRRLVYDFTHENN